jgi:hypothetical protein
MRATIHPGRPNLLMDHLQLGLRAPGSDDHTFYLSLYVIPWSRELGAGHVGLVRYRPPEGRQRATEPGGDDGFDQILADNPDLGRRLRDQLRDAGYTRVDLSGEPRPASFVRSPLREPFHVRYLISAVGLEVDAHWENLGEPILAFGPAPQRPESQDIWSVLFEAQSGVASINGRSVPGDIYPMQHWEPWLGRALCSAHIARSEIVVDHPAPSEG